MPPFYVWHHFMNIFSALKNYVLCEHKQLSLWSPGALKYSDEKKVFERHGVIMKLFLDDQWWSARTRSERERWDCQTSCWGKCPQHWTMLPSQWSSLPDVASLRLQCLLAPNLHRVRKQSESSAIALLRGSLLLGQSVSHCSSTSSCEIFKIIIVKAGI